MKISSDLAIRDVQFLLSLRDILKDDARVVHFKELEADLKERGFSTGKGLTRELDQLEVKLGGVQAKRKLLVDRSKSGVRLTPNGWEICREFEQILRAIENRVETRIETLRQRVNIGLTNSLTTNLLPRVLKECPTFLTEHSTTDLKVVEGAPEELGRYVEAGRVHFALGPRDREPRGCILEFLCEWKRVLLFNGQIEYKHNFRKVPSLAALKAWISQETLLIPPRNVMPELEEYFLVPQSTGRRIKLPQASLRRAWVEKGLGIAISHEEQNVFHRADDLIQSIDLTEALGTTKMYFYFPRKDESRLPLPEPAESLVHAIKQVFGK